MNFIILFVFIISTHTLAYCQIQCESICKTQFPPQERLKQLGINKNYENTDLTSVIIHVWLHIIRDSNGNGGLTFNEATNAITVMAADFENGKIYFYLDGWNYIDNDNYFDFNSEDFCDLITENPHDNAVDIYLLPDNVFHRGKSNSIPSLSLVLGGERFGTTLSGSSVLSHEMGHCLGLYHTHHGTCQEVGENCQGDNTTDQNQCFEELDNSNCSDCGDYVCDTPTDPNLHYNISQSCVWSGESDCHFQEINFVPDPFNIMAYSLPHCINRFSENQFDRMMTIIENDPIFENVYTEPGGIQPTPDSPTSLQWTHFRNHPKLNWIPSSTSSIMGYKIYRNLHGCGGDCGTYKYLGYTVGRDATTFIDWELEILIDGFNEANYYVTAFKENIITESNPSNYITVPTNLAERRANYDFDDYLEGIFITNSPNPFNNFTTISFTLPKTKDTKIKIYDVLGKEVKTIIDREVQEGFHKIIWNAKEMTNGVYLCKIISGHLEQTNKMILLK